MDSLCNCYRDQHSIRPLGYRPIFYKQNIIVAEINDTKISLERLNNEYQGRLQEMQSMISKDEDEAEMQKKIIKRTVLMNWWTVF